MYFFLKPEYWSKNYGICPSYSSCCFYLFIHVISGKTFKKQAVTVALALANLSDDEKEDLKEKLESSGSYRLTVGENTVEITSGKHQI